MITTHNLGFLRIGAKRELKFALQSYGKGETPRSERKALGYNCASAIGSSRLTWIGHQWVTSLFMTKCWI